MLSTLSIHKFTNVRLLNIEFVFCIVTLPKYLHHSKGFFTLSICYTLIILLPVITNEDVIGMYVTSVIDIVDVDCQCE